MKTKPEHVEIAVVGAGVSGLATGYALQRAGRDVVVLEAGHTAGGVVRTQRWQDALIELGANSFQMKSPELRRLFAELGIEKELISGSDTAKNRFILRDGRLQAVPMSPPAAIRTGILSGRAKLRLLAEPFIRSIGDEDESLASFMRRRFGAEVVDYIVNPFIAGVYAADPEQLSLRAVFPLLAELEQEHGSVIRGMIARMRRARGEKKAPKERGLFSFREGMQTIARALAEKLGANLRTRHAVRQIRKNGRHFELEIDTSDGERTIRAGQVVLATPSYVSARLAQDIAPQAAAALNTISYPPLAIVHHLIAREHIGHALDGFGFLVPEKEQRSTLGCIFSSSLFPGRSPQGLVLLTTFIGGQRQPELTRLPERAIGRLAFDELKELLDISAEAQAERVHIIEKAIPSYGLQHPHLLQQIAAQERDGLYFGGNFRGGPSVGDCLLNGLQRADSIERTDYGTENDPVAAGAAEALAGE